MLPSPPAYLGAPLKLCKAGQFSWPLFNEWWMAECHTVGRGKWRLRFPNIYIYICVYCFIPMKWGGNFFLDGTAKSQLSHTDSIMMYVSINFYPNDVSGLPQTEISEGITHRIWRVCAAIEHIGIAGLESRMRPVCTKTLQMPPTFAQHTGNCSLLEWIQHNTAYRS